MFEIEVDSVDETEEVKSEEEPNEIGLIKEPEVFESREKSNANKLVEPSVDPELTIHRPTSSNTADADFSFCKIALAKTMLCMNITWDEQWFKFGGGPLET
ncbi:hypothetical protein PVK06_011744 [Gossypium arboreum]|uniref:Uncharacterized protein n=1 Tax=Gossypium arboreum TaxID=29729 RepID=A0ABR0Q9Q8_GOSAR|nr:hypothetical protein PVK06_011744 [Gossypium arboreum]